MLKFNILYNESKRMLKIRLHVMLFIAVVTLLNAAPKEVVLVYENENNPPYALGNGKAIDFSRPGITLELLKKIEKKLDVKFIFKRVPWKRALLMIQTDNADGLFHASFKQERAKYAVYPTLNNLPDSDKSIMSNSYFLYTKKDSKLSWDGKKFINLNGKIGITKGFSIIDTLKDPEKIDLCSDLSTSLTKLNLDAVQGIVNLENRVDSMLLKNKELFNNIKKIKKPLRTKPYYLVFSKKFYDNNKQIVEAIWSEIKNMKLNGEYNEIKTKYFIF